MASDEEDDLAALRLAALATLKKKSELEDAQPIPQLTSSGHSLHNSNSNPAWADDFAYDTVPFEDEQPVHHFPNRHWEQHPPALPGFGRGSPTHYSQSSWRARGGHGKFHRPFVRGGFPPNQRASFGQNPRHAFGNRMQFNRNQRAPFPNQRLQFNPAQRPPFGQNPTQRPPFGQNPLNPALRPPFNQNPSQPPPFGQNPLSLPGAAPRGVIVPVGGGGNLIVINTVPEYGAQPPGPRPRFPWQQQPFAGNLRGGRGARGGGPSRGGRGGTHVVVGADGNPLPLESGKPVLLRPQDKYCPDATVDAPAPLPVQRKKKDKFSRYDSSGSDSDDDESEDDSVDEQPGHQASVSFNNDEEEKTASSHNDVKTSVEERLEAEISISAINTSHLCSDKDEEEEAEAEELDGAEESDKAEELDEAEELEEPVIDNIEEPQQEKSSECEAQAELSDRELNDEEEDRLLGLSPPRNTGAQSNPSPSQGVVEKSKSPVREPPQPTPCPQPSPPPQASPAHSRLDKQSGGSSFESDKVKDTDSSSSSSSASEQEVESNSDSDSEKESVTKNTERTVPAQDSEEASDSNQPSKSDSEEEQESSARRLPSRRQKSLSPPKKVQVTVTPEERSRLEARQRKFESSKEVEVSGKKRTISLKGIVPKGGKRTKPEGRSEAPAVDCKRSAPSVRTVQARAPGVRTTASHSHRKHSQRKVSLEESAIQQDSSDSGKSDTEDEDDEEEGGSRAWMREANKNSSRHKTIKIDQSLRPSRGSFDGQSYRGSSRNGGGGYQRRAYSPRRDARPEVHYSSSEGEDGGDRKLISVVVPRSSAGNRVPSNNRDSLKTSVSSRKRTAVSSGGDRGSDRSGVSKSKQCHGSEGPGSISVVISGDPSSSKRSRSGGSRQPVHDRLGKGSKTKKDARSDNGGRSSLRPVARNQPPPCASDDEGSNHSELDLRIRRIKQNNAAILRRQEEVRQDRELYG